MKLPEGFNKWNPALRGAYLKGAKAAERGDHPGTCPYEDKRTASGRLTWSRAYQAAWLDGYSDFRSQQCPVDQFYSDRNRSGLSPLAK